LELIQEMNVLRLNKKACGFFYLQAFSLRSPRQGQQSPFMESSGFTPSGHEGKGKISHTPSGYAEGVAMISK